VSNLSLGWGVCFCFVSKAHLSTWAPLSGPGTRPGIRPVIHRPSGRSSRCCGLRFPAAFRLPAFASWTPCPARRDSAPIAVGLPPQARIPAHLPRTLAGFTRFPRMRPGPGRALSMPRGRRCSLAIGSSVAAACRLTSAGPYSPRYNSPTRDVCMSRHRREFPGSRPVPVLPLACDRTWLGRRPLGVPVSSRPDRSGTGHACHGGDGVEH